MNYDHEEWVSQLSDEEYEQWNVNSAALARSHFKILEGEIAKAKDRIQQNPHDLNNIRNIGSYAKALGEMMQEHDYLGPIKMGLGYEAELAILNQIASIATRICDNI